MRRIVWTVPRGDSRLAGRGVRLLTAMCFLAFVVLTLVGAAEAIRLIVLALGVALLLLIFIRLQRREVLRNTDQPGG
jgi:hypothetical protein